MPDSEVTNTEPTETPSPAAAILAAVVDENPVGVAAALSQGVLSKIDAIVADRKQEIADTLVSPREDEDAGNSDEDPSGDDGSTERSSAVAEVPPDQEDGGGEQGDGDGADSDGDTEEDDDEAEEDN